MEYNFIRTDMKGTFWEIQQKIILMCQRGMATAAATAAVAMQKSKSSSSVVQHGSRVAKKLWRRSKSQGRGLPAPALTWTSQGHCTWTNLEGRSVTLGDVPLLSLSELERRALCKVALAKLQEINLGVSVRIPTESVSGPAVQKPKRRAYLLKRKALTTGIFDTGRKDKAAGAAAGDGGLVFGIPLAQCLENDRAGRAARRRPCTARCRNRRSRRARPSPRSRASRRARRTLLCRPCRRRSAARRAPFAAVARPAAPASLTHFGLGRAPLCEC